MAEIDPIGTRGRPGRGTGRTSSSAARGLAGAKPARGDNTRGDNARVDNARVDNRRGDNTEPTVIDAAPIIAAAPADTTPIIGVSIDSADDAGSTTESTLSTESTRGAGPDAGRGEPKARIETRDRSPLGGIPIGDWQRAIRTGAAEVFGEGWEPQLAYFLAFLRRRISGAYDVDEFGFDREIAERLVLAILRPLKEKWFRVEVRGVENIPADGGALIVSNHSGTLPMDALMTLVTVHDHAGRDLRPLGADLVFKAPFTGALARKAGATLACSEDAERMLSKGELVGVWPEGFKGIGKPYSERYKLQRFGRGGFVSAAIRTGVPIIPLSVVGAEEIYPLVGNVPALAKIFGLPYLPITPFFPLLGPLGLVPLPSKWLMEFGEPIRTDEFDPGAADDPMLVFNVTDQVRESIQQTLYSLLMQRQSIFR